MCAYERNLLCLAWFAAPFYGSSPIRRFTAVLCAVSDYLTWEVACHKEAERFLREPDYLLMYVGPSV